MQYKENAGKVFKVETKQSLMRELKAKEYRISDAIKNISDSLWRRDTQAWQFAKDISSVNELLFADISDTLSLIPDSEFVLSEKELNKKIAELLKKIDDEFVRKISVLASSCGVECLEGADQSSKIEWEESIVIDWPSSVEVEAAKKDLERSSAIPKKAAEDIYKQHSAFSIIYDASSHLFSVSLKDNVNALHTRLLNRVKSWRDEVGYTISYVACKKEELDNIEDKIKSLCGLANSLLSKEKKYQKEKERDRFAKVIVSWSRELEEALASLKKEHMKGGDPRFYSAASEGVAKILDDKYLLKSLEEKTFSVDLEARKAQLKKFHNSLTMPSVMLSASCFLSRHFNIMPNKNPFTMMNSKHAEVLYLATAAVVSAYLILYTARYALPKKHMNDMLSKYSRKSESISKV